MPIMNYCEFTADLEADNLHKTYHDTVYGYPVKKDQLLFERLTLELNQAGLSWSIILRKTANFRRAYHHFNIKKVANYKKEDREKLLNNAGIIRNYRKIEATIYNANRIIELQKEYGSFKKWLDFHYPKKLEEWVKIFKKIFKFTGKEITNEFLVSTGYLKGAHQNTCPVYEKVLEMRPPWSLAP